MTVTATGGKLRGAFSYSNMIADVSKSLILFKMAENVFRVYCIWKQIFKNNSGDNNILF